MAPPASCSPARPGGLPARSRVAGCWGRRPGDAAAAGPDPRPETTPGHREELRVYHGQDTEPQGPAEPPGQAGRRAAEGATGVNMLVQIIRESFMNF